MYGSKRKSVSKKKSRKNFRNGQKSKNVNHTNSTSRGGIRF